MDHLSDDPAASRPPSRRAGPSRPALVSALLLVLAAAGGWWWWQARPAAHAAAAGAAGSAVAAASGGDAAVRTAAGRPGGRRFGGGAGAAQPVSIQAARRQDVRVTVNAIGSIAAANTAIVHAQVGGVLQRLSFREGQQVKAGQLLAQIDPRAFEATLAQAAGALARDKAQLDNARIDLERYRGLLAKDAIAKQQLDTQEALVRQLEGTVKADQGTLDSARLQLSYTRVTAPIAGRAGLKQADLGNVVQPSDANGIVTIAQTRPVALTFAVPSAHVPLVTRRLRADHAIAVEAWARDGKTRLALGRVETVDNAIDATTDTIRVKALFPNADDALFPNQAVNVVLQLDVLRDVLAVPQAALLRGAQGFYVYVVNADDTVATRVVKPGDVDGGWIAVDGALHAGERVVIDGTDRLRDGAKVEVIAADPAQRAGAGALAGGGRRGGGGRRASDPGPGGPPPGGGGGGGGPPAGGAP